MILVEKVTRELLDRVLGDEVVEGDKLANITKMSDATCQLQDVLLGSNIFKATMMTGVMVEVLEARGEQESQVSLKVMSLMLMIGMTYGMKLQDALIEAAQLEALHGQS